MVKKEVTEALAVEREPVCSVCQQDFAWNDARPSALLVRARNRSTCRIIAFNVPWTISDEELAAARLAETATAKERNG